MKQEIKFKALCVLGDWHVGALSADGKHIVRLHASGRELYQEILPNTVCQYTGIKDKNVPNRQK